MQPIADDFARGQTRRPTEKYQKDGLEGIVNILGVAQDATADAAYHRPMTAHQRFKGRFVATIKKRTQQVTIGHARAIVAKDRLA
jgi:hypothetical protein